MLTYRTLEQGRAHRNPSRVADLIARSAPSGFRFALGRPSFVPEDTIEIVLVKPIPTPDDPDYVRVVH
jgi:hypothetical protein